MYTLVKFQRSNLTNIKQQERKKRNKGLLLRKEGREWLHKIKFNRKSKYTKTYMRILPGKNIIPNTVSLINISQDSVTLRILYCEASGMILRSLNKMSISISLCKRTKMNILT